MNKQSNLKNAVNYLASRMPSVNINDDNPIETLSVDDIIYLQTYLETIKARKQSVANHSSVNQTSVKHARPITKSPVTIPTSQQTRTPKRVNVDTTFRMNQETDYHNPYECGSKQNILKPTIITPYTGNYTNDPAYLQQMGIHSSATPEHIRNVDVESSFFQRELTHLPGQREITEKNYNRFDMLPFDPQDTRHIVWSDNMPRGGYATRNDRLELQ